jgi:hypothetical protein
MLLLVDYKWTIKATEINIGEQYRAASMTDSCGEQRRMEGMNELVDDNVQNETLAMHTATSES